MTFAGVAKAPAATGAGRRVRPGEWARSEATAGREVESEVSIEARALVRGILRGTGINPSAYRMTALARRIPACLRALGVKTDAEAARLVAAEAGHRQVAVNTLLLGVTDFFRDGEAYRLLRESVLPGLLGTRMGLRVLSAGCSDGSELYSLGMCLGEHGALGSSQLWGIDCREAAVESAKAGWYSQEACRGVPEEFRMRYMRPSRGGWQVAEGLCGRAQWEAGDLWDFSATRRFDLIACRNLAIYFSHEAGDRLWRKLHAALTAGGVLFTGKAERPPASFERIAPCLYRKV